MTARRRVAWGLFDQVLSSASNFVVTIVAARSLSASGFGAFAIALAVCVVSVFLARGMASDPLSTAHSGPQSPEERAWAARAGGSTALLCSLAVAVVTLAVALVLHGEIRSVLVVLAIVLPGLTVQDYLRYVLIVRGEARRTFLNDLFWMVIQLPLMVLAASWGGGAAALFLAWGVAGNLAAVLGLWQAGTWVGGPRLARVWLRRHRALWPYYLLDNIVYQLTQLLTVVVISLATSLAEVGGFRAAVTVFAPLTIVGRGIVGVAVPELARRQDRLESVRRASLTLACALAPLAVVWALVVDVLPPALPRALLGDSWRIAAPLVLPAALPVAASLFTVGTVVGMRAIGAGREGVAARLVVSVVGLACGTIGALWDGASGAVWLLAASSPVQILIWWRLLVRATAPEPAGEAVAA